MFTKPRIVPVLVGQFNEIIEWKAAQQLLQSELEKNSDHSIGFSLVPVEKSLSGERKLSDPGLIGETLPKKSLKLKRSKSQKCFTKKLNQIHAKAIRDTINEHAEIVLDRINEKVLANDEVEEEDLKCQFENELKIELELKDDCKIPQTTKSEVEPEVEAKQTEVDTKKVNILLHNPLLEKLQTLYRHNFVVKTVVVDSGQGKCVCGQPFAFSHKHLQCISCLTRAHTTCAASIPKPCIKFVDPSLKPSKLISNYVYPRAKPSIPALIIHCCGQIERKCFEHSCGKLKLYYVESEKLKPVKDEVRKLLQKSRLGQPQMVDYNLDYLCGMVKYFLSEICEPLFSNWKDYSINIRK